MKKHRQAQRKTSGFGASLIHSGVADCLAATPQLTHSQPRVHHRLHGLRVVLAHGMGTATLLAQETSSAAVHHPLRRSSGCDIYLAETTSSVLPRVDVAPQTELP